MRELGDEPPPVWIDKMLDLSIAELKHGVEELENLGENFPPSLFRFLKLCRHGSGGVTRTTLSASMPKNYERAALPPV